MALRKIRERLRTDNPEETTEAEKDEINKEVVHDLLNKHDDVPAISLPALQTSIQLIETARWALAMSDVYNMDTRRLAAQKKVAEHAGDKDDEIRLQAVQKKVREVFDGRYGRKNAQEHFDEVLEDIEDDYQARMEMR